MAGHDEPVPAFVLGCIERPVGCGDQRDALALGRKVGRATETGRYDLRR